MDLGIKGKRALVTGGATGIGQAIAVELAREGVHVAITSRKKENVEDAMKILGGEKAGHYGVVSQLSGEGEPQDLAADIQKNFGDVDILVNNVGSTFKITDPYCPMEDWRKIFRLNFEVAVELNNLFLPYMKKQDWGRIVTITSGAGLENSGPVTYSTTKAALTAYSRTMGRILATETKNVVMTSLMPGVVLTDQGDWQKNMKDRPEHAEKYLNERCPLKRFGKPEEISPMVVLLCSEKASFCQGAIVPVDAGQPRHYMYFNYM